MATITTSKRFSLNISDGLKAFFVAVLTPVFVIVISSLNAGSLEFPWKTILITALSSALAYISKNFFSSSKIVLTNPAPETIAQVKDGTAEVKVMSTQQ